MATLPSTYRLIATDFVPVNGRVEEARLYGTPHRRSGRRVVVGDPESPLFDSNDHHDGGNALNALQCWLNEQAKPQARQPAPEKPAPVTPPPIHKPAPEPADSQAGALPCPF